RSRSLACDSIRTRSLNSAAMTTAAIPTSEPTSITIGATAQWRKTIPNYLPADGWVLTYAFRGPGAGLDLNGGQIAVDGDGWIVTISATASATLAAGIYYWQAWLAKGTEKVLADEGRTQVDPNLSTISGVYDGRSEVKKTLDAIRAAIAGRATD